MTGADRIDPAWEACPQCGKPFEAALHRFQGPPPTSLNPFRFHLERARRVYTVRCPFCGATFVSKTLRLFGFVTYAWYWLIPFVMIATGFAVASMLQR